MLGDLLITQPQNPKKRQRLLGLLGRRHGLGHDLGCPASVRSQAASPRMSRLALGVFLPSMISLACSLRCIRRRGQSRLALRQERLEFLRQSGGDGKIPDMNTLEVDQQTRAVQSRS